MRLCSSQSQAGTGQGFSFGVSGMARILLAAFGNKSRVRLALRAAATLASGRHVASARPAELAARQGEAAARRCPVPGRRLKGPTDRARQLFQPAGGSQGLVPITPGIDTS